MIWTILQVAIGGAIGASGRFLTGAAMARAFGTGFPFGTLTVNVAGSFLMGLAFVALMQREGAPSAWFPFVMTGILGGFTTFSAFSLDLWGLFERGRLLAAGAYLGGSVALSVAALIAGIALARGVWG